MNGVIQTFGFENLYGVDSRSLSFTGKGKPLEFGAVNIYHLL